MTNLGASFKKARESKGILLDQIAIETRISTRFLRAIENEEFHLLPGGIFNRGFIRTYAERIGLDADQAVADYVRLTEVGGSDEPSESDNSPPSKTRRRLYPIPIATGALLALIVIFYTATRDTGHTVATEVQTPVTAVSSPAPAPNEPPPAAPETASAAEPATPEPASSDALALEIEANETTWIKIVADGNAVVPGEILQPGATRKITANNSIYLAVGNAAGLKLKINARALKPLGRSGEVRQVTITPQNLQDFIG